MIRRKKGAGAEGLEEWLAEGAPPVYVGFGSIPVPDSQRLFDALREVLKHHRVVFCMGWSVLEELPQHPNLFIARYANQRWQGRSPAVRGEIPAFKVEYL